MLHLYLAIDLKNKVIKNEERMRSREILSSIEVQSSSWLHSVSFHPQHWKSQVELEAKGILLDHNYGDRNTEISRSDKDLIPYKK